MSEADASLNLSHKWPSFVVIEGPIGVGKTTLAKKLSHSTPIIMACLSNNSS